MYVEEPRKSIDWGNVLKKGILIVIIALIIFLIIWLFARNNKASNPSVNYDNGNNNGNINNVLNNTDYYSKEYIENFRYFHDTAKEYFLISELPENGMTLKYTLQELIDKNLILSFGYNGHTCDTEASYVTVSNTNGKYHMTTTLVCGTEVAKTTEELGCNQLCVSGNCKVTVVEPEDLTTEYRYRQGYTALENVYTCPAGYTKSGSGKNTICLKGDESTVASTKVVTYNCPAGYEKSVNGDKVTCTKDTSTTTDPVEVVEYSCKAGYTKVGEDENTKCVKSKDAVNSKITYNYSCPEGTTSQEGSGANLKCYKTETKQVNATAKCSQGTLKNGKCEISGTTTTLTPIKSVSGYSCPAGYSVYSGSGASLKCYKTTTSYTSNRRYVSTGYYQSYSSSKGKTYNGCSLVGTYVGACSSYKGCTTTYYKYYCSSSVPACPNGYSSKGSGSSLQCYKSSTSYADGVASGYSYSCPAGTTSQSGSGANLRCYKTATPARTVNPTYTCSTGKVNGTKCDIENKVQLTTIKTPEYSCENGYKLNESDHKCYPEEFEPNKNVSKKCPDGFKDQNGKCVSTGKDTQNGIKTTEYTCPAGYTKFGLGADSKCTKGNTTKATPTVSSKNVTKYRYTWSPLEYLEGWERTGETRQVKAAAVK